MGIRYCKRINYGDGLGLNVSRSGVSPIIRTNSASLPFIVHLEHWIIFEFVTESIISRCIN